MAKATPYTTVVAARTRAAQQLLAIPELLAAYLAHGGLKEDLVGIVESGLRAEAANRGQSVAQGDGEAATSAVLFSFDGLRTEYSSVMGVVQAVHGDLTRAKAPVDVIVAVEQVLANEVPVRLVVSGDAAGRKAAKVQSQEAIRAEIQKDAGALLGLKEVHAALARRKVDGPRLARLEKAAAALAGKVGERSVRKGAAKTATAAEHEAVKAQSAMWGASYRLLAAVANGDARVQQLLTEAARKGR